MKKELIVHETPKSPISEIFRTLRTNIQFMNTKGKLKSILVTSTLPGEGKSWVSSNLAVTFAQAGKKVILIDADMRKGRQYTIFEVAPRPGLSNYLSGIGANNEEEDLDLANYIQETKVENLYLLAAGNVPPNPSELLIAPQMVELLEKLKKLCDIVIIDGTPSQLVTDSLILARFVDSTLIVSACKETKKEDLKRVINNIKNVGGKIAGIVANKTMVSSKSYEQSYYYGSTKFTDKEVKNNNKFMKSNVKSNNKSDKLVQENRKRNTIRAKELMMQNREKEVEIEKKINRDKSAKIKSDIKSMDLEKNVDRIRKKNQDIFDFEKEQEVKEYRVEDLDQKTQDILKQVNEYLANERNNTNTF